MPANSAEPLGVHGINPVGNTYCGFLSGLRVLHKYRSDLIEHPALARRRERGNVAHAPHPIDDIVVTRPGPRLLDGLRLLVAAIHPEIALPSPAPSGG